MDKIENYRPLIKKILSEYDRPFQTYLANSNFGSRLFKL